MGGRALCRRDVGGYLARTPSGPGFGRSTTVHAMKKLLVLIVVVALAAFAVKKLQDA
jgi:hypothetical protein